MKNEFKRISPEEALNICQNEHNTKGRLKIFLGYAPGVGKTFAMLNEANRRLSRNQNIVVGYLETHKREETEKQLGCLPIIPRKIIEYNGMKLEEMDTDAIIKLKPETVLIDELAHTNVIGSKYKKRYEDVLEVLNNGINVLTTVNIQHLESLNDVIKKITGIDVKETIPDKIVENADEVVMIDVTPEALQNRLKRGNIYRSEIIERALKNFFRRGNLNALREIALRLTAEEVDEELAIYMKDHGILETWPANEKVMVCITPAPYSKKLIRRGARIAKRYKCDWTVISVDCTHMFASKLSQTDYEILKGHFELAKTLGASIETLKGKSVSSLLSKYAKDNHITQIIIGHSRRSKWQSLWRGSTITKLLKETKDIEVHVIPD